MNTQRLGAGSLFDIKSRFPNDDRFDERSWILKREVVIVIIVARFTLK